MAQLFRLALTADDGAGRIADKLEELAKLAITLGDVTPVCCSERGEWVNLANFERWWRSFRENAGFDGLRFGIEA